MKDRHKERQTRKDRLQDRQKEGHSDRRIEGRNKQATEKYAQTNKIK